MRGRLSEIQIIPLFAALALAPLIPSSNADFASKVSEYINAQIGVNHFSGSVLIAKSGKVFLAKGYGMASADRDVPNSPSTKFRLGAIVNQFTAMAILELQKEGKLDVQDAFCKYIPDCPQNWQEIKIENLLSQTSGLTDFPDEDSASPSSTAFPTLLARYKDKPLEFKPGQKMKYCNFGYEVLGVLIEKVSKQPRAKYLEEHIFKPLGMRDTGYDGGMADISHCASGYRRDGDRNTLVAATCSAKPVPFGNGGAYSTVEDVYRWDRALYGGKIAFKESVDLMFTPYRDGYGFAWRILKEFQRRATAYSGRTTGFSSAIRRYPDDDACVIVLSNLESIDSEKISHDLAAIVFGEHYELPREKASAP